MSKESHMEMVVLSQHKSQISGMISENFGLVWPGLAGGLLTRNTREKKKSFKPKFTVVSQKYLRNRFFVNFFLIRNYFRGRPVIRQLTFHVANYQIYHANKYSMMKERE